MKRQKVLFLKENYVLRVLKSFMVAGLFVIALLLILVHKIDLGLISGVSKGVFFHLCPAHPHCRPPRRRSKLRL